MINEYNYLKYKIFPIIWGFGVLGLKHNQLNLLHISHSRQIIML